MRPALLRQILALGVALSCSAAGPVPPATQPAPKPKPEFQYQAEGIAVSIPSADEPRVTGFDASTVEAAARYLEHGAISWVQGRACINCHTTGPYMAERPGLTPYLGPPNEEIRANFVESLPAPPAASGASEPPPKTNASRAVWTALGLAEWDRHVTGTLSEPTSLALREMMRLLPESGAFPSTGEVEIPHITTDFELTLQAARAITAAPGWLETLRDADLIARVERMKAFLRDSPPRNDYERLLRLRLAALFPDLVRPADREAAVDLLAATQQADGGWSLRDMSATDNWRTPMSEFVLNLIASLPDAARPESDPYMTAFAIILLRESGIPATDERIRDGIAWLKREQRVSGRWWMHSLYRGNYHYITYIATAQAMKALSLCGEFAAVPAR